MGTKRRYYSINCGLFLTNRISSEWHGTLRYSAVTSPRRISKVPVRRLALLWGTLTLRTGFFPKVLAGGKATAHGYFLRRPESGDLEAFAPLSGFSLRVLCDTKDCLCIHRCLAMNQV